MVAVLGSMVVLDTVTVLGTVAVLGMGHGACSSQSSAVVSLMQKLAVFLFLVCMPMLELDENLVWT